MIDALNQIVEMVKRFEGCKLKAYPDPGTGGAPWTIGYGETLGVNQGDTWTQEKADYVLRQRVGQFMLATLKRCPALHLEPPSRTAACTSLAYNIGVGAFGASSVSRKTMRQDFIGAANAFLLWNKAGGRIMRGLTNRRQAERKTYMVNDI
jgi:lysozyme